MSKSSAPIEPAPTTAGGIAELETEVSLVLRDQLCFALYAASRAMTAAYRPHLENMGITYPQYLVLLVLWERGPVKIKELAASLSLDHGTLSPLIKRMERAGLVNRERMADDERAVQVELTPDGAALEPRARHMLATVVAASGVPLSEIRSLRERLTEVTGVLTMLRDTPTNG